MASPVIGIVGAGKLGVTLAQLAVAVGYTVYISGSGVVDKIALTTKVITPGAIAATTETVATKADIIILALPLSKVRELDSSLFSGKLVIDSMNHWFEIDGPLEALVDTTQRSSEMVQAYFPDAVVVKTLNHMGYHHLHDEARQSGAADRRAIALAGDKDEAVMRAAEFVDALGFDPLVIGTLADSKVLEAGERAFGANLSREALKMITRQ